MYENTSRSGYARRIDAMLRARYPYLQTQLFEVAKDIFQIVFDATLQDAASISEEFHNSIRFMTVHVTLSNTRPNSYLRELSLLSDEDAMGDMGGLPLRRIDLVNLLVSRFPDAGILDVKELPENYGAAIVMKDDLAAEHEAELLLRQAKPWRGGCHELKPLVAIQRVRLPPGKGAARQPEASLAWRAVTPVVKRRQQVMKRRRKPRNR